MKHVRKACYRGDLPQGEGLPLHSFPCVQERWWSKTSHKSEVPECIHAHRALQDGGHTHPERPAKRRRLDGKSGPEGCVLHGTNSRRGQSLPQVLVQKPNVSVQMPTIWPSMCPLGLHQDPEASHPLLRGCVNWMEWTGV